MELGAVFVPVTYDTSPLLPVINAHRCLRLLVKLAAALAVAIAMVQVIRSRTWTINRQAAALYLAGAAFLVPTAILTLNGEPFTPAMRFVYAAIPFSILAVAGVAATAWKSTRILRLGLAALFIAWVIWQVYLIRNHPGTRNYRATSREWKHFVSEIGRLSQQWPPMQAVTVYSGPPHGSRLIPEGYGLALFRVHYPNLLAAYFENRVIPETTRAYIFDGKHLRPTEF